MAVSGQTGSVRFAMLAAHSIIKPMTLSAMSQVAARAAIRGRNAASLGQKVTIARYAGVEMFPLASTGAHVSRVLSSDRSFLPSPVAHYHQEQHNAALSSRAFFSTQPTPSEEDPTAEVFEAGETLAETTGGSGTKKAPSILLSLDENYTTGAALNALRHNSAGGKFIRLTDFRDLALSARRGYKRDASSILTALKDFRRNNAFIINVPGATVAMEGMLRACTAVEDKKYGAPTALNRVEASLYVMDAFLDETTGLYYASTTELVETNMKLLLEAARDADLCLPAGYGEDTKDDGGEENDEGGSANEGDGDEDDESSTDTAALAKHVLDVTRDTMAALIKRGRDPTKHMRKRAARKYRKHLRAEEGPSPSTAHVGVEIFLALGASSKVTKDMVLSPYQSFPKYENWFPPAEDATVELVSKKEKDEQDAIRAAEEQAKAEAEAAAAEAAAAAAAAQEAEEEAGGEDEAGDSEPSEHAGEDAGEDASDQKKE